MQEISDRIREFNRFYTKIIGLLNQSILDTQFSLPEARVLFEINRSKSISASGIISELNIDKGYLSRILRKFEKQGLIAKKTDADDARIQMIYLTSSGQMVLKDLDIASNREIEKMISNLNLYECKDLILAMDQIRMILSKPI